MFGTRTCSLPTQHPIAESQPAHASSPDVAHAASDPNRKRDDRTEREDVGNRPIHAFTTTAAFEIVFESDLAAQWSKPGHKRRPDTEKTNSPSKASTTSTFTLVTHELEPKLGSPSHSGLRTFCLGKRQSRTQQGTQNEDRKESHAARFA